MSELLVKSDTNALYSSGPDGRGIPGGAVTPAAQESTPLTPSCQMNRVRRG